MKRNIKEKIHDLSYDSVRELANGFELDNETKSRIYIKTIRRAKIRPKLTIASKSNDAAKGQKIAVPQEKARKFGRFNMKKTTAVIIAAALAMTVGVGSMVGAGALNKSFGQYFHTLPESNYENMLFEINQTKSDNGVTVTLTQGMCDGLALYVIEKVEFDPSVITLTDDMFVTDEYGSYSAPRWGYSTLINVKETSECDLVDIGGIVERQNSYQKLLEHDDHSMTYLMVFGYPDQFTKSDKFFSDGNKFTVRCSHVANMPGLELSDEYDCHIDLTFDIPTVSTPNFYTLPEEIYSLTNVVDDACADVIINPWYMRLSAGSVTGKVVDTSLNTGDSPEIEITMNDGKVYTEKNGISMHKDDLGADYTAYENLFFEFDTPLDVTNIKSIKLYGHELKKGVVAADASKVRKYDSSSGMKALPAESEVKFSDELKTVDYRAVPEWDGSPSYGQFKYKINSIKVYDNAYATGSSSADDFSCDIINPIGGFDWNEKTGDLGKDWYMLEYEIELTNVNANFSESLSTFDFNNTGCFEQLFDLYCYNSKVPSNWDVYGMEAYIRENEYALTGQRQTIKLNKGETKTFHVSFFVKDNKAGGFNQVGLCVGGDKTDSNIEYVNISKMINEFNASK